MAHANCTIPRMGGVDDNDSVRGGVDGGDDVRGRGGGSRGRGRARNER
jgi:hypothetical protein